MPRKSKTQKKAPKKKKVSKRASPPKPRPKARPKPKSKKSQKPSRTKKRAKGRRVKKAPAQKAVARKKKKRAQKPKKLKKGPKKAKLVEKALRKKKAHRRLKKRPLKKKNKRQSFRRSKHTRKSATFQKRHRKAVRKRKKSRREAPPAIVLELEQPTAAAPLALVPTQLAPTPSPPVVEVIRKHIIDQEVGTLSTQDLIRPSDTLRDSIESFLLDQRSPHTRKAYGKDLTRFMKFLIVRKVDQGIENLSRTVLIAYKEFLISEELEHTTIDRHIATLRSFFQWLVDDGLLSKSPADGVRFLNPKRLSTTIGFEDREVTDILKIPDLHTRAGSMHYAILMVLFYCGLRRSELCGLKMANLGTEREQRVLRLRGKGNAERVIVMIPSVWSAIQHYLYISRRNPGPDEHLFNPIRNNRTGVLDKPLDPSMIFYIVTKYAKLAGIANRVSPHSCRATAISNARDHHVPDRAIQEFAGWASPDMITRSSAENERRFLIPVSSTIMAWPGST